MINNWEITLWDPIQRLEAAENRGLEIGFEKGIERGTEQRSKAKTLELIQNLHDNAAPIPFIAEVIGLPVEEVQTIIEAQKRDAK